MKKKLFPLAILFIANNLFSQNIWYVNEATQSTFPTGNSWQQAFPNLQSALFLAQAGDEIWMAKGTYKPTDGFDRFERFNLPSGIGVYGGFAGNETSKNARDWFENQTILSGDIGIVGDSTDNSYTIMYAFGTDEQTRVDGLIFEYGNAYTDDPTLNVDSPLRSGGAIYLDAPTEFVSTYLGLYNCAFRQNRAKSFGASIFANGYDDGYVAFKLDHCLFENNYAGLFGAGVSVTNFKPNQKTIDVSDCIFRDNQADKEGGAFWARHHGAVHMTRSIFDRNISRLAGAAVYIETKTFAFPRHFEYCDFSENKLFYLGSGSALAIITNLSTVGPYADLIISKCRMHKNLQAAIWAFGGFDQFQLNQSIFDGNDVTESSPDGDFPSVLAFATASSIGILSANNCLFYDNDRHEFNVSKIVLNNCILISRDEDEYPYAFNIFSNNILNNCIVSQATCEDLGDMTTNHICNNVQFALDPLLIAPGGGDFHLLPCSPAINAGVNAPIDTLGIMTDLDESLRIRNNQVDIGPYELNISLSPDVITKPSCTGQSDGSFSLSGNICSPYTLQWSNGNISGSNLTGLSAGTYILTITDANDLTIQETVVVPEQDALILEATAQNIYCPGTTGGSILLSAQGGVPFSSGSPYHFTPDLPLAGNLVAGFYNITVTDANGCSADTTVVISEPPPFTFYYTVQNASSPNTADGAILFDSIVGGWSGAVPPADMVGLLPGTYTITVTDDFGCTSIVNISVGFTSALQEPLIKYLYRLYPNPAKANESIMVESNSAESFNASMYDVMGRFLQDTRSINGRATLQLSGLASGLYRIEITGASSQQATHQWIVIQ